MWKNCAGVGRHAHLDVVLGAELQEALEARRRMLRALALVAVRQEHREAAHALPLGFARGDELVDHDLRAVHEVAELRLPDHQLEGLRGRVAVLEAEHRLLGEQRVDDDEVGLPVADVLQRDVDARIPLLAVLVVEHRVAVGERAAPAVLAGEAHRVPLVDERRVGEVLGHAPVERHLALAPCRGAWRACARPSDGRLKFGGIVVRRLRELVQLLHRHGRSSASWRQSTPMYGAQSHRERGLRGRSGSSALVGLPASSAARVAVTISSPAPAAITPSFSRLLGVELARARMLRRSSCT